MTNNRSIKTLLVLICVALWGILLRFLFAPGVAQSGLNAAQPPTIFQAQAGIPYLVVSGSQVSVWYVDVPVTSRDKHYNSWQEVVQEQQDTMKNTRLIRADAQSLPTR
jgi:hypothetical protein